MSWAGFAMLGTAAALLLTTGLPVFAVLIAVASLFAAIGVLAGAFPLALLGALTPRIVGLLENDLIQALPLYVLMGALVNRLPLAELMFRGGLRLARGTGAAPLMTAVGLGALLAPMNGSVGASAAALSRIVLPRLAGRVAPDQGLAVVCVASTLGVVVPPSLVLILLGDAMLRAHTEAVNATQRMVRIVNTQDLLRGALGPAALMLAATMALAWWRGRRAPRTAAAPLSRAEAALALAAVAAILALLGGVAAGRLYAVEAAATGAVALAAGAFATGALDRATLRAALADAMAASGALFALFLAAGSFTMVVVAFGTDRVLAGLVAAIPGGAPGAMAAVLALLALCAFVLDAFEIVFMVIPLVMPPLLMRVDDPVWAAVLVLLVLQASFLIPPAGYAVMMARAAADAPVPLPRLARALMPFLLAQGLVLAATLALPQLVHLAVDHATSIPRAPDPAADAAAAERMRSMIPPPDDPDD